MPLPVPLSTESSYVTTGYSKASCSVCRDDLGSPLSFHKNGIQKHIKSAAHLANVKGLKSLQKHKAVQPPKSMLPSVQTDAAVEGSALKFGNSPTLAPQPDIPSISHEEFLSIFECLTAPQGVPTADGGMRSAGDTDNLFEDCITHGQPAPDQHDIC